MRISKVAFAITALLAASQVNAAGFQINESSASGLGRAFSGEAAIGDDAASLARNPALMARFEQAELSVVGTYIIPEINVEADDFLGSKGNNSDVAPEAGVPAMYYIQPLNEKVAVGLAIYSGFGLGTDYGDDYVYGSAAGKTEIITVNFNPNVSYRLNDKLSVGAGVDFVYATAELKRNAGLAVPSTPITPSTAVADMEGDGYGIGWNAGVLYEVNDNHRFGISYKSKVKLELEGDYTGTASNFTKVGGDLDLNLPSALEVSAYHKLNDKFAISYDWLYTTWSDFGDILATSDDCNDSGTAGQCLLKEEEFDNSSRYSIGGEYYYSEALTLRVGYAYDEQAGKSTLSIPDTDRQWFTTGMTYRTSSTLSFDFATAYILGDDGKFDEDIPLTGRSAEFKTESDAIILSAQMNYRF